MIDHVYLAGDRHGKTETQELTAYGVWRFSGFNEMVVIHLKTVYNIKITINEQIWKIAQNYIASFINESKSLLDFAVSFFCAKSRTCSLTENNILKCRFNTIKKRG